MAVLPTNDPQEIHRYHRVMAQSVALRTHQEVLVWLQGDMQRYVAQDVLIAAWGNFSTGEIQHDVLSELRGVRSEQSNPLALKPLLLRLFARWESSEKKTFALTAGSSGFLLDSLGPSCTLGSALRTMRSAMVHGIKDARGGHDCLYVVFSTLGNYSAHDCDAMDMALPYIDNALRQVAHLPHQVFNFNSGAQQLNTRLSEAYATTEREFEILNWIALGKTNPEIASILEISLFTVKNHIQCIFRKLNVSNRAQAVAKLTSDV
jgi:transcriptional regulator EpsA